MQTAIITSKKDTAGINIKDSLLELFDFKELEEKLDNNPIFQLNDKNLINNKKIIKLYTIETEHIHSENIDKKIKADLFVFATRHRAASGLKTLSCHPIGNFGKAEFGGQGRKLCITPSNFLKNAIMELDKYGKEIGHEVTMEATHHGPFIEKPAMFIEIGSNEENWKNKDAGNIITKTIIKILKNNDLEFDKNNRIDDNRNNEKLNDDSEINKNNGYSNNALEPNKEIENQNNGKNIIKNNENKINENIENDKKENNEIIENKKYESVFIMGGSHYNHVANKTMLKTNFAVGHICAKYNLENLDLELIKQAMEKTMPKAKFILLDWKGLGKEKQRILEILEKNNIKFERSDKFFD